jgi:hypothetical protein
MVQKIETLASRLKNLETEQENSTQELIEIRALSMRDNLKFTKIPETGVKQTNR